jgi:hypothetical protein
LDPEPAAGALKKYLSADTCIYRRIYRQKQANMNSEKSAYVPVCGGTNHEMCIYLFEYRQIQAQIMHIFLTIQANTGKYELPNQCIYACMCMYVTCKNQTYRHI